MRQTISDVAMDYILQNCGKTITWCVEKESGYDYFYCKDVSRCTPYYTRRTVFLIFTNNPKWCAKILPSIIGDDTISKGVHDYKYKQSPTIANALTPYHTVTYNELLDCYEYTIVHPYDD